METPFCIQTLGESRGKAVMELVESSTGKVCPCIEGAACPLDPSAIQTPVHVGV